MSEADEFEVVVVGGGPAGMTTALYTTRLNHDTAVVDRGGGRAAMMMDTHNVLGVPESTSGKEWLNDGWEQLEHYGTDLRRDFVTDAERTDDGRFRVTTTGDDVLVTDRLVLATGFSDERPDPPLPRTGRGLHYCLHCDAEMFVDESVYVMGHGDSAATVAMIMLNFTDEVDLLLDGDEPTWSGETERQLRGHPVEVIPEAVTGVNNGDDGWLDTLEFADSEASEDASGSRTESGDGAEREYKGGFAMYGSDYNTDLHESLGAELNDDGTVAVDDHGNTSVEGLYAVGDVTPGHNQIPTALGEGARAGIDIHYGLREYPRPVEELDVDTGEVDAATADD